jgi:hypothetical protein
MKNQKSEKRQTVRKIKRELGEWRIEGRLKKNGSRPAKERPYWYCDERKKACLAFEWHKFVRGAGVAAGGSTVLIATRERVGKVLVLPSHYIYRDTAKLFRKHRVLWWSYMPAVPMVDFSQTHVLWSGSFDWNARWCVPKPEPAAEIQGGVSEIEFGVN